MSCQTLASHSSHHCYLSKLLTVTLTKTETIILVAVYSENIKTSNNNKNDWQNIK